MQTILNFECHEGHDRCAWLYQKNARLWAPAVEEVVVDVWQAAMAGDVIPKKIAVDYQRIRWCYVPYNWSTCLMRVFGWTSWSIWLDRLARPVGWKFPTPRNDSVKAFTLATTCNWTCWICNIWLRMRPDRHLLSWASRYSLIILGLEMTHK